MASAAKRQKVSITANATEEFSSSPEAFPLENLISKFVSQADTLALKDLQSSLGEESSNSSYSCTSSLRRLAERASDESSGGSFWDGVLKSGFDVKYFWGECSQL